MMAKLDKNPCPGPWNEPYQIDGDWMARWKNEQAALAKLERQADALPEGEVVGAVLHFPVADGSACYLVTKARPLTVQHIPFGDAWHADPALLRGLNLTDVKQRIKRSRWLPTLTPLI